MIRYLIIVFRREITLQNGDNCMRQRNGQQYSKEGWRELLIYCSLDCNMLGLSVLISQLIWNNRGIGIG